MNQGQHLLLAWSVFAFLGILAMISAIVWGIRSRQFSNQDRIRHLPLESPAIKEIRNKAVQQRKENDVSS